MSILNTVLKVYKSKGFYGVKQLVKSKFPKEKARPIKNLAIYTKYFKNKKGIEIGGPSPIFSKEVPIYAVMDSLDGCNFSHQTVWEGNITQGNTYNYFEQKKGIQYICEASELNDVASEKYDFLVASHCLEHCANTLKTVTEWLRVVKKGGAILLILPDRRYTFDHKRPITSFNHLLEDFKNGVDETDLTHVDEIVSLHDLTMDSPAGTPQQFKDRSLNNYNNRCLHHHVFDFDLLKEIYSFKEIEIVTTSFSKPYHQIILGVKK